MCCGCRARSRCRRGGTDAGRSWKGDGTSQKKVLEMVLDHLKAFVNLGRHDGVDFLFCYRNNIFGVVEEGMFIPASVRA